MTDPQLQARLESHSQAFEGLLALIPAKVYYGENNDDQWQRKKQTKEQKRLAKKAKLEPGAYKSALDVHKERENSLKRKHEGEESDEGPLEDIVKEEPREGLKTLKVSSKKQKLEPQNGVASVVNESEIVDEVAKRKAKAEKRKEKRERKKLRVEKRKAKQERKKARTSDASAKQGNGGRQHLSSGAEISNDTLQLASRTKAGYSPIDFKDGDEDEDEDEDEGKEEDEGDEGKSETNEDNDNNLKEEEDDTIDNSINVIGLVEEHELSPETRESDSNSESNHDFPVFDAQASSASSISSILPPSLPEKDEISGPSSEHKETNNSIVQNNDKVASPRTRMKILNMPKVDSEVLRERLSAKLAALRAARNADGPDGKPARNRQELIEARRRKEERRKAHKKELRAQVKEENTAEAEAARLRGGSGSPLWSPGAFSPKGTPNSFSFGRVEFNDGAHMDSNGSGILDVRKSKGPQDPRTALEALQKKKARINGFDEDKRADIEEKDLWLNAKKRIHGEKIRDDMSLLKRTLKRKEKGKFKSEKEWNGRVEDVEKGKEMRQKRREDNLAKRRDDKGSARSKGRFGIKFNPGNAGGKKGPVKKRPGFEGTFKTPARRNA